MSKDPTRTLTLRKRFEGEVFRRFRHLKGLIRESLVKNDALGLMANQAARPREFDFPTTDAKIAGFMEWLRQQENEGIINVELRGGRRTEAARAAWFNVYIQSAYQQGIQRARQEMAKAGGPRLDSSRSSVQMAFNRPFHADRVGLIYIRAYNELAGITQVLDQQISRVLAQGMAEGLNPLRIANLINDRVDKIGITRARMLARTEVIRAHHLANIQEYREAGAAGVEVEAEWVTAGDSRVCSLCASLSGKTFGLEAIESMIPRHPNCFIYGTEILTYEGWKAIEDISYTDLVYAIDQDSCEYSFKPVQAMIRGESKTMVSVNGVEMTPDHDCIIVDQSRMLSKLPASSLSDGDPMLDEGGDIVPSTIKGPYRMQEPVKVACVQNGWGTLMVRNKDGFGFWTGNCRCVAIPVFDD